jgi:hypothetical protein
VPQIVIAFLHRRAIEIKIFCNGVNARYGKDREASGERGAGGKISNQQRLRN